MKKYPESGESAPQRSRPIERRQFLRGAGGAAMLLPFMPSLLPRKAWSQTVTPPKRFVYVGTEHGAASFDNVYGTQGSVGATPVTLWPGNTALYAPLQLTTNGGTSSLSPIYSASSTVLTPAIVQKMNVIRGIDFANNLAHHDGGHLGNNNAQVDSVVGPTLKPMVTIDQLMAYSPNFYTDTPRVRSVNIGGPRCLSWTYTNPSTKTGVQQLQRHWSSLDLFNSIFGTSQSSTPTAPTRPLIIDRVLSNYQTLRNSNRRLSAADKVRLDDHVARLTLLEQQIVAINKPLACGNPTAPADNTTIWNQLDDKGLALVTQNSYYKTMADILLTAFNCGASRIAVFHEIMPYSTYQGDWHQDIAHQATLAMPQSTLAASYQQCFEHVFMYLVNGLDAMKDPDGSSVLDNSLVYWGHESGYSTHNPWALPIVMAGKASGYFKTGLFVDYRNQVPTSQNYNNGPQPGNFSGLIYPQMLATALYSMGIKASEWTQPNGLPGYGDYKTDADSVPHFINPNNGMPTRPAAVITNASMPLPIITGS
jgi:hypothetical protein